MRPIITRLLPKPQQPILSTQPARTFTTTRRFRLKEDADRTPSEVEQAKQDSLKKQQWNRETASASEEVVGADQQKVKDHGKHMEELQKQTAQKSEEEKGKARTGDGLKVLAVRLWYGALCELLIHLRTIRLLQKILARFLRLSSSLAK